MELKDKLSKEEGRFDLLHDNNISNNKPYKTPVLTEYGDVANIVEAGGAGSQDVYLGPTFI